MHPSRGVNRHVQLQPLFDHPPAFGPWALHRHHSTAIHSHCPYRSFEPSHGANGLVAEERPACYTWCQKIPSPSRTCTYLFCMYESSEWNTCPRSSHAHCIGTTAAAILYTLTVRSHRSTYRTVQTTTDARALVTVPRKTSAPDWTCTGSGQKRDQGNLDIRCVCWWPDAMG